jgi:hypothetical protein
MLGSDSAALNVSFKTFSRRFFVPVGYRLLAAAAFGLSSKRCHTIGLRNHEVPLLCIACVWLPVAIVIPFVRLFANDVDW